MKKILVVDDEKMMLKMASRILSKKYETILASSGPEAIDLFRIERPDMVLSDLLMPEMDGYALHRILQEISSEPVPIMFMTADESDESESRGFRIGAADYIRKPFKPDVLLRRVENIIDNLDKIHELKRAADLDALTGLLNKAASTREITQQCVDGQGSLMMIDLDSFKLVNDLHGHAAGDKILVAFADILRGTFRQNDLIGRPGGDEFIAFCNGLRNRNEITKKVEQINQKLLDSAKRLLGADMNIPLGASIGCIFVPDEGIDFEELSRKADKALYSVKQGGKHGCAFYGFARADEDSESTRGISEIEMILGERNKTAGAFRVEFDQFKVIYRLAVRLFDNYQKEIQFVRFVFDEGADETTAEEFCELLKSTLRRSDCITRHGDNQILVLLMEASMEKGELVVERILRNWNKSTARRKVHCEIESVGAD